MNPLCYFIVLAFVLWIQPEPSVAFIARSTGCHHNGTWYADKSIVPTVEKCLNCQCSKKTLVCRLKVCPEMPMPPPRGCVVVQKKNTCCPYLSCARLEAFYKIPITRRIIAYLDHYERESIDRVVNENMLQRRSDDSELDMLVCVKNGTVYKSGSAMSSSNLCSYCYCIGGTEKCVKPKCMLPVEGCKPIFVDSTCCPVRYDCSAKTSGKSSQEVRYRKTSNKHFMRMSQRLQRNRGCTANKQFYAEGQKMKSDPDKPCDICFCIRGSRRCAPKKCSPALKNCIPVVPKGQCCPSSYDCGSQRDYRRAQNSRQFNLFSLLFGKDEEQNGPSTDIPVQYPHDRDPALAASANKYTHEEALEASSEKSILDTLREGLEFIDGSTNQMVEENSDLLSLQAKRESIHPKPELSVTGSTNNISTTTEVSFLDLLLGETNNQNDKNLESEETEILPLKVSTENEELSWVDLLLGPSNDHEKKTPEKIAENKSEAIVETSSPQIQTQTASDTSTNISRVDDNIEEQGTSGEIFVGTTEYLPNSLSSEVANETTTTEKLVTVTEASSTIQTVSTTTTEMQNLIHESKIKPIPLHASNETSEKVKVQPAKVKPTKNNNLLSAFLDGISDILTSEETSNSTKSSAKPISLPSTIQVSNTTKTAPSFRPLPTQKTHTRINSKIANVMANPPAMEGKPLKGNVTLPPMPPKLGELLKLNQTKTTTPPTTSTTTIATTTTSKKPTTAKPTIVTSQRPLIINTNPTILEAEPLDDSTQPTLPPSLPNLKIIPFLPTDAVEAANTKTYEYYQGSSPSLKPNYELYEDVKVYPAITEGYASFSVDLDDEHKTKYIYKFNVEGPEGESQAKVPLNDALASESLLKYEFVEKNGFSPPTKTEGGFLPKDPLLIDDAPIEIPNEVNSSKQHVIYEPPLPIIDLTTAEPYTVNLTNIIEITTPDPFKDVIHTESPPDLAEIIKDKANIDDKTIHQSVDLKNSSKTKQKISTTTLVPSHSIVEAAETLVASIPKEEKNSIESFIDILFKEEEQAGLLPKLHLTEKMTSSTIPPFKTLPQTTMERLSSKSATGIKSPTTTTTKSSPTTTKKPQRNRSTSQPQQKNKTKTRVPTSMPPKAFKLKNYATTPTTSQRKTTATKTNTKTSITTLTPTSTAATPPTATIKPTTTTTTTTTTIRPTLTSAGIKSSEFRSTTHNPFIMSPFDKLPFMDASFEIKQRQQQATATTTTTTATTITTPSPITPSYQLTRLDGLQAAYEVSLHPNIGSDNKEAVPSAAQPAIAPINDRHSLSSATGLIDPAGILKLAGCNIYGRMYRVGRIILELSSPCVECRCTETGVKCGQLDC